LHVSVELQENQISYHSNSLHSATATKELQNGQAMG
jgi:hypothetical protein